jgi:hypothetical protein
MVGSRRAAAGRRSPSTPDVKAESMTGERAAAYGRIMRALGAHFGLAARDEIARIREACDALVFTPSASPRDRQAMTAAIVVLADVVERGGISRGLAVAMVEDIGRCAPPQPASAETVGSR